MSAASEILDVVKVVGLSVVVTRVNGGQDCLQNPQLP